MIESHNLEPPIPSQFVRTTVGYGLVASLSARDSYWRKQRRRAARILADAGLADADVVVGLRAFTVRCRIEAVAQRDAARLVALADADGGEERP